MDYNYKKHLITTGTSTREALSKLDTLGADAILFVVSEDHILMGSLTDGDIRRGLIKGRSIDDIIDFFSEKNPHTVLKGNYTLTDIINHRENGLKVLPVVNKDKKVLNVINFRFLKSYLPVDAIVMAGGRGERLKPLTDKTPKPMLIVGDKPIIDHNISRLISFGIDDFWISIKYLGNQIEEFFGNGESRGVKINYLNEDAPLGTIGAISKLDNLTHDYLLVTNSDLLTNLDYENFFLDFINSDADFSVATIPYNVNVPYAILETENGIIKSFKEKPTYTYYANAGIYLMKKEICSFVPKDRSFHATDLIDLLLAKNYKVSSYPLRGYWLDIGKHDDYVKAQHDINYIKF